MHREDMEAQEVDFRTHKPSCPPGACGMPVSAASADFAYSAALPAEADAAVCLLVQAGCELAATTKLLFVEEKAAITMKTGNR